MYMSIEYLLLIYVWVHIFHSNVLSISNFNIHLKSTSQLNAFAQRSAGPIFP